MKINEVTRDELNVLLHALRTLYADYKEGRRELNLTLNELDALVQMYNQLDEMHSEMQIAESN